jgi:hypothetical protein
MDRYFRAKLGFNCTTQSFAATSNEKWILPTMCNTGYCTHMMDYPCTKCEYVSRYVREDPSHVHPQMTETSRPRWSSVLHTRHG